MFEPSSANSEASVITEAEFIRLCDDIYGDRYQIYDFNPGATKREAVMWMLLGCLISLLSINTTEQSELYESASHDPYTDAIRAVLQKHMRPPFDPQVHLAELSGKLESEAASEAKLKPSAI